MLAHPQHAMRAQPGVRGLADDITAGRVCADSVAPFVWPSMAGHGDAVACA